PGGYTNWHCHNGATFFVCTQGLFEAHFQEGTLVKAKAGDVYSEPIGKFHRGHNPHPELVYSCIGICLTPPDRDHITTVKEQPWWARGARQPGQQSRSRCQSSGMTCGSTCVGSIASVATISTTSVR